MMNLLLFVVVALPGSGHLDGAVEACFSSEDAHQGIAADAGHVYAVASRAITKHDKETGAPEARWEASPKSGIIHLDSGVVHEGKLYCAHSNYPDLPMTSSIEVWDTETLEHVASHSLGIMPGSCTWVDWHGGAWWAGFAHYAGRGGYPDKGPEWTAVLRFDEKWRRTGGWVFPAEVIRRMTPHSNSGGSWGPDGHLYCTGHDRPEVYVMALPEHGSELRLVSVRPFPGAGQGIAFDRSRPGVLYGIIRSERLVVRRQMPEAGE